MQDVHDDEVDIHPKKRFQFQSHKNSLKSVHLPLALNQTKFDQDLGNNDSHFHEAINRWRQLNLSPAFLRFADHASSLSASMPLLLLNWKEIVQLWTATIETADDEAIPALLELLQSLAHDLRMSISPSYLDLLRHLLQLLPRFISAPALTALLETFSALFKYILIASNDQHLIQQTWSQICNTLPKCDAEVQRAMAEVCGASLRRMKVDFREQSIVFLAENLKDIEDSVAYILVYACKSVSQTLHSVTISVLLPLVSFYLSCSEPDKMYTLIRRVLTALVHHCKSADAFSVIGDALVEQLSVASNAVEDQERLRRLVEVISVPLSVRQGSRMSQKHVSIVISVFPKLPLTSDLEPALLKLAAAALIGAPNIVWTSVGLTAIEHAWTSPSLGIKLTEILAELGWKGWKMVALPALLKRSRTLLDDTSGAHCLAQLWNEGKVLEKDVDLVWRRTVDQWVVNRLSSWEPIEDKIVELGNVLSLSNLSPHAFEFLIRIIDTTLGTPNPKEDFHTTFANTSWVLGSAMQALAKRNSEEWSVKVDVVAWALKVIQGWGWSEYALAGLLDLVQASPANSRTIHVAELHLLLRNPLLSHSRSLRLSSLRLLTSKLVISDDRTREVFRHCLQGEEVSLDVQGVRGRVLKIGRVGQLVRDGDELGADVCIRWLTTQLKVNLRPLWSAAATALGQLSQRFGDHVWSILFPELQSIAIYELGPSPSWFVNSTPEADSPDASDPWEEERSWRDPSAHKLRSSLSKTMRGDRARSVVVQTQICRDRLDVTSYEQQLLHALTECPSLAEKHNREIVPFFLSLGGPDASHKLARTKLSAWLGLFAKFHNPKSSYATTTLYQSYVSLLSHPDRSLQLSALSCILTYKSSHLLPYEDKLRALLDDTRWRDELTLLDMAQIEMQDRQELVDVMIRLLFGMMLEKKGRSRGADRRAAVLGTLGGCTDQELGLLVDLMLGSLSSDRQSPSADATSAQPALEGMSDKQQLGFLTLLGQTLKNLGPRLLAYWPALIETTVDLIAHAQSRIDATTHDEDPGEQDDTQEELNEPESSGHSSKVVRSIRTLGLRRFADFFRSPASFDFKPYLLRSFESFVSPRLLSLDKENTQAPSALLELLHVWTLHKDHVQFLVDYDSRTLPQIYACLVATNVKPAVVSRILDIVDHILDFASTDANVSETVLKPHVSLLLNNLAVLVEHTKGAAAILSPNGQRQIGILSQIAAYLTDANQAATLLSLFSPLLRKPPKLVSEKVKVDMLTITANLLTVIPALADRSETLHVRTHETLSELFHILRNRRARLALISTFQRFATIDPSSQGIADLLESLNAYSTQRIEEPDFDRRLTAFKTLNEDLYNTLSVHDWLPVLYNMLSFIQDPLELTIRNNASYTFRRFIDLVTEDPSDYQAIFVRILWPKLKNGLHSKNELVRAEILGVIAYAVTKCHHIGSLQEMQPLLAGGDEEANFFNNIHHIQIHRRTRALRRLADQCDEGILQSSTLAEVFVPLIGNYITATNKLDHHLVNEAIITTGRMAKHMSWRAYYALVQKYVKLCKVRDEAERVYVRTLVAVLENFHFRMDDVVDTSEKVDEDDEDEIQKEDHVEPINIQPSVKPDMSRIADAVNQRLLPTLLQQLEKRNETEDTLRIPLSIGIVKVAQHLPSVSREPQISKLLTVLSQILRSKSSETRDLVRETLCQIAITLGPSYLPAILRELRGALLRGPQLHVLAYVTHALLVHITTGEHVKAVNTLDECVNDVAHVSAEVIFGESGKDVEAEEFKTKMREVRSAPSKGLDSFAIIAKHITPPRISGLLNPLRAIMQETESLKVMQKVEEVLRRIASGLNSNDHLVPTEFLVLCHTLISKNALFLKEAPSRPKGKGRTKRDVVVQTKREAIAETNHYTNNSFRFVTFGLDLFQTSLRRSRYDFQDQAVMTRLDAMVAVVGNTLYSNNALVITLALKSCASIVKCPLKSLDASIPVFIRQIIEVIRRTGSTESEVVQVAFKSLASILRDCPSAQVKEKDLVYILELISPDLEDTSRQGSVFTMLRAIVARKFVVPEIYDLMDKVSEVMVTSQSPSVQELCRGVLLQFLLDYPQGKGRLRNHMTFLAKNLSYVYESGRKSVMEILGAIIAKFEVGLVREYADLLFVALVMVIANDDSAKCREMAAELIKALFARLDEDHRNVVMSHLHSWAAQHAQPQLARVSTQVYGIIIDLLQSDSLVHTTVILEDLDASLARSSHDLHSAEVDDQMDVDLEWQAPYHALNVLSKVLRIFPDFTTQREKVSWNPVVQHLLFPHAWVRTAACRLLGVLFAAIPINVPNPEFPDLSPLSAVGMRDVANKLCIQLKSQNLDSALGLQIVKNLFYIGKCFYITDGPSDRRTNEDVSEGEDEDGDGDEEGARHERPLPWLFSKLSYQAKSAHIARRNRSFSAENWSEQSLSILRWFAAMASYMAPSRLESFLVHILSPVFRIMEDDTIRDSQMNELKTVATELQDLVQSKVGTTQFSTVYSQIKQKVMGVRRDRKVSRATQLATDPEAAAKRRIQKNAIKKDSRKRKNQVFTERKGKMKRRRED